MNEAPKPPRITPDDIARWRAWVVALHPDLRLGALANLQGMSPTVPLEPVPIIGMGLRDRQTEVTVPKEPEDKTLTLRALYDLWFKAKAAKKSLNSDKGRFNRLIKGFGENTPIMGLYTYGEQAPLKAISYQTSS